MANHSQKKHIITIAGRPGSGKSTTAKEVARRLGYAHFSSGDLFRALANEMGIDVLQANVSAEQNAAIDHAVDQRLRDIGQTDDDIVIDSRMAWHWMPGSFKVYLDLELDIAAQRILENMDEARANSEKIHHDPAEYVQVLKKRHASEVRRYRALYDVNPFKHENYDLVIDTGTNSIEQTVTALVERFEEWLSQNK